MASAARVAVPEGAPGTVEEAQARAWQMKRWKSDYIWLLEKRINLEASIARVMEQARAMDEKSTLEIDSVAGKLYEAEEKLRSFRDMVGAAVSQHRKSGKRRAKKKVLAATNR